jgi:RNA polymerase sigma-70 factor (ECF subfamily)
MSVEEVAQALDIPEPTVRSRFFRARSLLRESLASDMDTALGEVFAFDGARCDRVVANVLARAKTEGAEQMRQHCPVLCNVATSA